MIYFAYGSNMDLNRMKTRCPDSLFIGKACLNGYKIMFDKYSPRWGCGVADIVGNSSSEVWGLIYEVTESDLKQLDHYEGVPDLYIRIKVNVIAENNKYLHVTTYEVVTKESFAPPTTEYLSIIKEAAEKFNFPDEYKQMLANIKVKE